MTARVPLAEYAHFVHLLILCAVRIPYILKDKNLK
jgi:hypothetical protein